jgi:carbon-monoxide dehydrogenase medium subunit
MIAAAFDYHRPADIAGAIGLLTEHGDRARVIAGGHSLIPMMKLRMTAIDHLVDLQAIPALRGISIDGGRVRIGAMVTQAEVIAHEGLAAAAPILRETALQIADPQVRSMGTVGGNVANGDPGNDLPAVMQCLDAEFTLVGPKGTRQVPSRGFYHSAYVTARAEDEILTEIGFAAPAGGHAYEKQKRKIGDYATAACAVQLATAGGRVTAASVAMTNLADRPVWSPEAGAALTGTPGDDAAIRAATAAALAAIDPAADNRGPVEFKRHVAGIIIARAIARALARA